MLKRFSTSSGVVAGHWLAIPVGTSRKAWTVAATGIPDAATGNAATTMTPAGDEGGLASAASTAMDWPT